MKYGATLYRLSELVRFNAVLITFGDRFVTNNMCPSFENLLNDDYFIVILSLSILHPYPTMEL